MKLCQIAGMQRRIVPPGQTVFLEGDQPEIIYQVVSGLVKLTRVSRDGREMIVALAAPGDFLDVAAVLDGQGYGVTARAVHGGEVELSLVPRSALRDDPALVGALERMSLEELRAQRDWTVALALERVETRALSVLKMLARRLGNSRRLRWVLNRQEFAELIGTTTETAIRVMSRFRRDGLVLEQDGWLTLA